MPLLQAAALEWSTGSQVLLDASLCSPQAAAVLVAAGLLDLVVPALQPDSLCRREGQLALDLLLPVANKLLSAARGVAQHMAAAAGPEASSAAAVAEAAAALELAMQGVNTASVAQFLHAATSWLPPARRLAAALLAWWRRPEAQPAAALELAQAAAARSCAYLRCANLGGEGGPAAGQGAGSQRCRWAAGWGVVWVDWSSD